MSKCSRSLKDFSEHISKLCSADMNDIETEFEFLRNYNLRDATYVTIIYVMPHMRNLI